MKLLAPIIAAAAGTMRAGAAPITIENDSPQPVRCQVSLAGGAAARELSIRPGTSESFMSSRELMCQFDGGSQQRRYRLEPGRKYQFVRTGGGQLELWAVAEGNDPLAEHDAWQGPLRDVSVLVVAGPEYRAFYRDWQARAAGIVSAASARFERNFGLRFRVVAYQKWQYTTAPRTADEAFGWLHRLDGKQADLVVAFTLVSFPGSHGEIRGLTQYFSRYIIVPDGWGTTGAATRLVHELCHVLGAFHVSDSRSVMQPGFVHTPTKYQFGQPVSEVLRLTREVDLRQGVEGLSTAVRDDLRRLYRDHHHPAEKPADDPVAVGYRYQARLAEQAGDMERARRLLEAIRQLPPVGEPAVPATVPQATESPPAPAASR